MEYHKTLWGLPSLLRWKGSAFPRALPFTLVAVFLNAILHFGMPKYFRDLTDNWDSAYPFQAFAVFVAFGVVFRCVC